MSVFDTIYSECNTCGRVFGQPDDPGRRRTYCSNACRQKAYRARGGRASGTRGSSRWREQRRAEQEAWANEQARKEQERQRSQERRGRERRQQEGQERREQRPGATTTETPAMPTWVFPVPGDSPTQKRARAKCYALWSRASHWNTNSHEARTCRAIAEKIRGKYAL